VPRSSAACDHNAHDALTALSEVAEQFRASVHAKLAPGQRERLGPVGGDGVPLELRRALHLTDRAVRQWAARATEHGRAGHISAYARLGPLKPDLGHEVQRAAHAEQELGLDARRELIAQMAWGIGQRLAGIEAGAPPANLQQALNQMAVEAGEILLAAGQVLDDEGWVVDEANDTLRELVAVR
jgi:hypothetical protein